MEDFGQMVQLGVSAQSEDLVRFISLNLTNNVGGVEFSVRVNKSINTLEEVKQNIDKFLTLLERVMEE